MKFVCAERGSATIWSLALTFMLLLGGCVAMATGQVAVARQQVSTAMDLAALAGAQTSGQPCDQAQFVAQANGAQLNTCYLDRGDVVVSGTVPAPGVLQHLLGFLGQPLAGIGATARAGQPER